MSATMSRSLNSSESIVMNGYHPRIFIVDSDAQSVQFITEVVRPHNLQVEQFASGEDFWRTHEAHFCGCAIIELELPGMSGIQLQERMSVAHCSLPIIMTATEADLAIAVRSMKLGAVDFFQKPCHPLELWEAIQVCIEKDRVRRLDESIRNDIRTRVTQLTAQEHQVMQLMLACKPNKAIANLLDLSLRSIDFRRASILRKMQAHSSIELAQMLTLIDYSLNVRDVG
ncbi:MAG TPA: response regulator [Pirellulales bacterium]|nr:response regulator [Pirellulales bacterium]